MRGSNLPRDWPRATTPMAPHHPVLDALEIGIWACDRHGRPTVCSRVVRESFGAVACLLPVHRLGERVGLYREDGVTALPYDELPMIAALGGRDARDAALIVAVGDDRLRRTIRWSAQPAFDEDGQVTGAVAAIHDVTAQCAIEQQLRARALLDPLTGLLNRSAFAGTVERELGQRCSEGTMSVLFVDLDGFHIVNERHGHAAGDAVLAEVAERLAAAVRQDDTVARLAADEFVVMSPSRYGGDRAQARDIARRIVDALGEPFHTDGQPVQISASVGIAYADREGMTAPELLAQADAAMYSAKRAGKSRWATYTDEALEVSRQDARTEVLLRRALDDATFETHYQPLYDLAARQVIGVEALARVPDGDGGYLSPDDFIPVAEKCGLIGRVGETVLRHASRQVAAWKQSLGDVEFGVGVNLSVSQLEDPQLVDRVQAALNDSGLSPGALVLELTESVFSDSGEHTIVLGRLRELGVKLLIDDFGTGHSSLSYLRRFDIDGLKIDRSFVADLTDGGRDGRVTRAIVRLALDLGVTAVAEGIETEEQLATVQRLGCELGQGFLMSRPVPADQVTTLLATHRTG